VSNPSAPFLVQSINTGDATNSVVMSGSYAYISDNNTSLNTIDVSNLSSPIITGSKSCTAGDAGCVTICAITLTLIVILVKAVVEERTYLMYQIQQTLLWLGT
jgi:hypothetical protein